MALQLTTSDIAAYRIGLYGYFNLGLEKQQPLFQNYIGGTINSRQAYEEMRFHAGLGLFKQRFEGENVTIDDVPKRFTYRIYPVIHSLGIEYTHQAEYKDIYGFIKSQAGLLAQSWMATRNLMATNAFVNFAFSGGTSVGPDSLSIYNSSHTTVGATVQSNVGTASLSYFSIADALTAVMNQKLDRDDLPRIVDGGYNLWCGTNNVEAANRILSSMNVAGTNANDSASWVKGLIKTVKWDPYIGYQMTTTANAWGLIPAMASENPFRELQIEGIRSEAQYLISNDTFLMVMHAENAFIPMGWQGTYANKP